MFGGRPVCAGSPSVGPQPAQHRRRVRRNPRTVNTMVDETPRVKVPAVRCREPAVRLPVGGRRAAHGLIVARPPRTPIIPRVFDAARTPLGARCCDAGHDLVAVGVHHEVAGEMAAPDRCNAVCTGFVTRNPTVAVVVPRRHLTGGPDRGTAHSLTSVRAMQGA